MRAGLRGLGVYGFRLANSSEWLQAALVVAVVRFKRLGILGLFGARFFGSESLALWGLGFEVRLWDLEFKVYALGISYSDTILKYETSKLCTLQALTLSSE